MNKVVTDEWVLVKINEEEDFETAMEVIREWLGFYPCMVLSPTDETDSTDGPWNIDSLVFDDHELYVGEVLFITDEGDVEVMSVDEAYTFFGCDLEDHCDECCCCSEETDDDSEIEWENFVDECYSTGFNAGVAAARERLEQMEFRF